MSSDDTSVTARHGNQGIPLMEQPMIGLLYMAFVFLPLVFQPHVPLPAVLWSLLASALFLPLYFGRLASWKLGSGTRWLGAAALGLLLIPVNPGGNTFLIYSAGLAGHLLPRRQALWAGLGLALLAIAAFLLSHGPQPWTAGFVMITLLIGGMVLSGSMYEQLQRRRQAELALSQDEVRRLARNAERERIARDLHDLLGHTLSLVVLKSELAGKLLPGDPAAARAQIGEVEQVARQALGEVREAVSGYRRGDFEAELAATRLALLSAGVEVEASAESPPRRAEVDHALALSLREACTNVLRHSRAHHVTVELSVQDDALQLQVRDDGRGGAAAEGNGLGGIRERLAALGGTLVVDSPRGGGTRLGLRIDSGWQASKAGA